MTEEEKLLLNVMERPAKRCVWVASLLPPPFIDSYVVINSTEAGAVPLAAEGFGSPSHEFRGCLSLSVPGLFLV